MSWDVFISHASEDKESFVRKLAQEIQRAGLKVWYDEFSLSAGDSLRESIDAGISKSLVGIVVLSKNFFKKDWPRNELNGLFTIAMNQKKTLIPVWLEVTASEVAHYSPMLADKVALRSDLDMSAIIREIKKQIANYKLRRLNRDITFFKVYVGGKHRDIVSPISADWLSKHGYGLPTEAIFGILLTPLHEGGDFLPDNFRENLRFIQFLHLLLSQNILQDKDLHEEAQRLGKGYVYLIDGRAQDPQGDVPFEDILGWVKVQDGRIIPNSYQRNFDHLLLTENGFFMLPSGLESTLMFEISQKCSETTDGEYPDIELKERIKW